MQDRKAAVATAVATQGADFYDPVAASFASAGARFPELSERVKAAGLLDLRPVAYFFALSRNLLLLLGGLAAFVLIGDSWWNLAIAALLGVSGAQSAFMWHDAGHKAMFRGKRAATAMGLLHANLINGVSYGWWVTHHNRHHSFPNNLDLDPDIGRRTIIFDIKQYPSRRGRQKLVVRYQHVLFFVLLVWESVKIHRIAYKALTGRTLKQPVVEGTLLLAHAAIFLTSVFLVLSPVKAILFVVIQQAVLGVYFGMIFAPNHKGMEIRDGEESLTWLERQVLTSRNIRPSWFVDWFYGGLNYQIEHHLFPAMPQMNLGRCRVIVRDYCQEYGIPYHEVGFFASYREVAGFLYEVSAPVRRGLAGQSA
ncbi:MAG TPA: acyl-CoA desaturase [Actinocrinis sp.]|uniref:fatty acid desaturase family protein n=1 Tax=Actinocrinis sp. TaxID=1920516 RepID=UPI002DDCB939|nr:acyl-CoA desaturase [Actinocrinis sp.]HEV2343693.1 acyl-CoA desaturase [Actinocrinis sp.]